MLSRQSVEANLQTTPMHDATLDLQLAQFLQDAGDDFLQLPVGRIPDFESVCCGAVMRVYVYDAQPTALMFFQKILKREPRRFAALNRAFYDAQIGLHHSGWAVAVFVGSVYLSLAMHDEIFVRRVPTNLTADAISVAERFNCYFECAVS